MPSNRTENLHKLTFGSGEEQHSMDAFDPQEIIARLHKTGPVIEEIRAITGNAGLAIGVLHRGRVLHRANYGYRDVESRAPPNSDTVFPVASITKAMIAAQFTALAEDKRISLNTRLRDLVPEYRDPSTHLACRELATHADLVDLLAHRLGITGGNNFWSEKQQQVLIRKPETARIVGSLQPLIPFRSGFIYSNWGYGLAGEILESITGESFGVTLRRKLFTPLGLTRTTTRRAEGDNVAKSYMILGNATPYEVPPTAYVEGTARAAAGAVKSTVTDLLRLYGEWMAAANDQASTGGTSTPGSPFKQVAAQWSPNIQVAEGTTYGLGWMLARLPGRAGLIGANVGEAPELPIVAKHTRPQRLVYHQGSVVGSFSAVYLLPDTETAVVVLGNSFDLGDTPDWVSQVLIEALLDAPEPNNYVELARLTAANVLSHHPRTRRTLETEQQHGTARKPLRAYAGRYYNRIGNFYLDIAVNGDGLRMTPKGYDNSAYNLRHYHHDVFWWNCDRDAECMEALYPQYAVGFHRVSFEVGGGGGIVSCNWQIDKAIEGGETFLRADT